MLRGVEVEMHTTAAAVGATDRKRWLRWLQCNTNTYAQICFERQIVNFYAASATLPQRANVLCLKHCQVSVVWVLQAAGRTM